MKLMTLLFVALALTATHAQGNSNGKGNGNGSGNDGKGNGSRNQTDSAAADIDDTNTSSEVGSGTGWDGGVEVQILGQSGKMRLVNSVGATVTVEMDSIHELDAAGSTIGLSGPNTGKHGRNTFANVEFTIDSTATRTSVDGVLADRIDFQTTLLQTATLTVSTWVFLGSGTISCRQHQVLLLAR